LEFGVGFGGFFWVGLPSGIHWVFGYVPWLQSHDMK